MKMLFRNPVAIKDNQLSVVTAPVLTAVDPLFRDVLHSQVQYLEKAVISKKYEFCLGHFFQLSVKSFDRIGSIDQLPKLLRKLEISAEIRPILIPGL